MQGTVKRKLTKLVLEDLDTFPCVAILGPRQCGKSTLAAMLKETVKNIVYIDLENPADLRKLDDPLLFFEHNTDKLVCLDEIQRKPELFPVLRSVFDKNKRKGQALILGSASRELLRQSSESLAGRISYIELTPFLLSETDGSRKNLFSLWNRGGFPDSYLAKNDDASLRWRRNFIRTFLERDIPQLGITIPSRNIEFLWRMLAHSHGQLVNASSLGESIGVSHHTVKNYLSILEQTFMVRLLKPCQANLKKRLVKSPKVYIRDSGILNSLLEIDSYDDLMGHPVFGSSWEGLTIENILTELYDWRGYFYRSSSGSEIDLVLEKGRKRIAVECKVSTAPELSKGFYNALKDLQITETRIIAPVETPYAIGKSITVSGISDFIKEIRKS
ncbi:MAG: ATP-binding protein [Spirochaetes bacterium]|nr:ATP-binding protein [Spirochaetota bacterium]MBN2769459.1 ATP-binding protein [Spirochaetota bacterium]